MAHRMFLLVALAGSFATSALGASSSPADSLAAALRAARAQHSVHYVLRDRRDDGRAFSIIANVEGTDGVQWLTYRARHQVGLLTIVVNRNRIYFRGNAFMLWQGQGYREQASKRWAGRWIAVRPADHEFYFLAGAATLPSEIDSLELLPPLHAGHSTSISGQRVTAIAGRTSHGDGATLYALAVGAPLPLEERIDGDHFHTIVTYSRWNERVRLPAPSNAVPIAKTGLD